MSRVAASEGAGTSGVTTRGTRGRAKRRRRAGGGTNGRY